MFSLLLVLLSVSIGVLAAPTPRQLVPVRRADAVTSLSVNQLSTIVPFTQFARAAYCPPEKIQGWQCGEACDALPGFNPTLTGGDGNAEQFFFVGHFPQDNSVVVAHQGTDPVQLMSDLTDLKVLRGPLDATLFPGLPSGVEVHTGFRDEHAKTASQILTEVKKLLADNNSKTVTLIGHSLGGALAELDSLFMTLNLPSDVAIQGRTFGTPRVGNDAFVQLFDSKVSNFQRVNNEKDLVPIVPGRFLGFEHPQGEIHLVDSNTAVACPGNDDADDDQCQIKTVPNILEGNILNHLGPYQGIFIGTLFCN